MASIPELLKDHVTLEVECLDRLYLNGYIGPLATSGGLVNFMREQLGKPIPSPVVLGQVTEKFRETVKALAEERQIPIHKFDHKERKDDLANELRKKRGLRDQIVFIGVAQEKAQTFQGKKEDGHFQFSREKAVYVNHYYFYIDDADYSVQRSTPDNLQVTGIERLENPLIGRDLGPFLRDVNDHLARDLDSIARERDRLAGLLDLYQSSIANQNNEATRPSPCWGR